MSLDYKEVYERETDKKRLLVWLKDQKQILNEEIEQVDYWINACSKEVNCNG